MNIIWIFLLKEIYEIHNIFPNNHLKYFRKTFIHVLRHLLSVSSNEFPPPNSYEPSKPVNELTISETLILFKHFSEFCTEYFRFLETGHLSFGDIEIFAFVFKLLEWNYLTGTQLHVCFAFGWNENRVASQSLFSCFPPEYKVSLWHLPWPILHQRLLLFIICINSECSSLDINP